MEPLGLDAIRPYIVVLALLGFPLAVAYAWAYERRLEWPSSREPIAEGAGPPRQLAADNVDVAEEPKSIVVLPFTNMSADPENEYFADGIAEELLNLLTTIPELRVVSRSSAFSFKGKDLQAMHVAQQLNVDHLLEGSVRKAGNRVRITAQLIAATSDSHLWSQTFDRTLDDIFAIQDEIAAAVVSKLKVSLLGPGQTIQETDPAAYTLFLQARHLASKLTAEAAHEADELYQQVLQKAPSYAPAWTGSAVNHVNKRWLAGSDHHRAYQLAREAVTHALAHDGADAIAHSVQGTIAMGYDCDFSAAARHYQRALELAPNSYDILQEAGWFTGMLGRTDEAIAVYEHLAQREPLNPMPHGYMAWLHLAAQRPQAAMAAARTAVRLSPTFADIQCAVGWSLLLMGKPEEARAAIEQETNPNVRLWSLSAVHHEMGHTSEAEAVLGRLMSEYGHTDPLLVAMSFAWQGDTERTFEWLDKAAQCGDPRFNELLLVRWVFGRVEDDPRWRRFLERNDRSPAQVDSIHFKVPIAGRG